MGRIRLWDSVWLRARADARLESFLEDWAEIGAAEEYAQRVYSSVGEIMAQFWQVEAGLVEILSRAAHFRHAPNPIPDAEAKKLNHLTLGDGLKLLEVLVEQSGLTPALGPALSTLRTALASRNRLTHGRVAVGVSRIHPDAPPEPVIVLVSHQGTTDELDELAEEQLATSAIEAMAEVAVALEQAGVVYP